MPPTKRATKPRTPAAAQKRAEIKAPAGLKRDDEFDCRPDGTVRWRMANGTTYWLRDPLLGEMEELLKLLEAIQEEVAVEQERLRADLAGANDDQAVLQLSIEVSRKVREYGAQTRERVISWWERVFELLEYQGRKFPVAAAPSAVITSTKYLDKLREHWNRPSPPGD